jgi:hypothetical protein
LKPVYEPLDRPFIPYAIMARYDSGCDDEAQIASYNAVQQK